MRHDRDRRARHASRAAENARGDKYRVPGTPQRPYRVTGYPVTPLVFAAVCVYLIYSSVAYKPLNAAISCGIVLAGLPLYWLSRRFGKV